MNGNGELSLEKKEPLNFLDLNQSSWKMYVSQLDVEAPRKSVLHTHPEGQLIYAVRGTTYVETQDKHWVITPNRAIWIPPHYPHRAFSLKPIAIRTIYVQEDLAREAVPLSNERCLLISSLLRELIIYAGKFRYTQKPSPKELAVFKIILDLIMEQEEEKNYVPAIHDPRLLKCRDIIMKNLDQNKSLEELAKGSGAGIRTLTRLIQQELQTTFIDWKNTIKIFHSLALLEAKNNVTEVAYDLGFDSPNSFIRAFKKIKGVSPKKHLKLRKG